MTDAKPVSMGYAHQGLRNQTKRLSEENFSTEINGNTIKLQVRREKPMSQSPLYNKYDISNYNLHPDYEFSEASQYLIPHGTPEYVDRGDKYVERIVRALYYFKQCALIGPSGTGKTHITYLVAELTGLPVWEVNCGVSTSSYDLIGRYIGLGKGNWVDGQLTLWLRHGGLLYLDEANMMKQDVATRLNPVLDTRGHLVINEKDSEIVTRHPFGYVIISMNPNTAEFSGTKQLNAAFRRRMAVWIDFEYQSIGDKVSQDEVNMVKKRAKVDENIAYGIIRVGAEMRRQYIAGDLPYGPSVGDLINWAVLVSDSKNPDPTSVIRCAEETLIAMTSDNAEIQREVRRIVENVFCKSTATSKTISH